MLAVASAGTGAYVAHRLDGTVLATSQAQTADAKASLSAYEASVATKSANASAAALAQQTTLQARLNALQSQLAQTQKDANAKSAHLQALLAAAQPGQVRALGPVAGEYYRQLRGSPAPNSSLNP